MSLIQYILPSYNPLIQNVNYFQHSLTSLFISSLSVFLSVLYHFFVFFCVDLFQHLFTTKTNCVFYLKQIFFTIDEDELAHPLRRLQEEYTGKIDVGSYPNDSNK